MLVWPFVAVLPALAAYRFVLSETWEGDPASRRITRLENHKRKFRQRQAPLLTEAFHTVACRTATLVSWQTRGDHRSGDCKY